MPRIPQQPKLLTGPTSIRRNVTALMGKVRSPARQKGIITLAKNRNISHADAKFVQAKAIAIKQSRKPR